MDEGYAAARSKFELEIDSSSRVRLSSRRAVDRQPSQGRMFTILVLIVAPHEILQSHVQKSTPRLAIKMSDDYFPS